MYVCRYAVVAVYYISLLINVCMLCCVAFALSIVLLAQCNKTKCFLKVQQTSLHQSQKKEGNQKKRALCGQVVVCRFQL